MRVWQIRVHPDFLNDLDRLSKKDLEIFSKKRKKILQDPKRLKHLGGMGNCYREPITSNIRLVYYVEGDAIWFLTIGKHDEAYEKYLLRIRTLREKIR